MAPKLRYVYMEKDDLAWEESDAKSDDWESSLRNAAVFNKIGNFILMHRPGKPVKLHTPIRGGYNAVYRLEYEDGSSAAMRIPCEAGIKLPDEKVRYEVATMRYIAANTTIPVPEIYHWGTAEENPLGLGPFIIMEYIEHEETMFHALKDPLADPQGDHCLDPDISEQKLRLLYGQMANILLQLSTLTFPQIGSLVQDEEGQFSASGRPLLQNMNAILELTDCPASLLKPHAFSTSDEWYSAMADMHLTQLTFQHNDAVEDEEDARDKYVARQLFRKLASDGQLSSGSGPPAGGRGGGPFRLFSEDLQPANILIDKDLRVVGVIDWEFSYAAPAEFSFDPPWWLLLQPPDKWPGWYDSWMEAYEPRLETFLSVLEEEESKARADRKIEDGLKGLSVLYEDSLSLSQRMRMHWESECWIARYAARKSWALDYIFWRYLDPKYFGENEDRDHHARLSLLSLQQVHAMDPFVKWKMEQSKKRIRLQWTDEDAQAELSKIMI